MRLIHVAVPIGIAFGVAGLAILAMAPRGATASSTFNVIPSRHPVTAEMKSAAEALKKRPMPIFSVVTHDGDRVSEVSFKGQKPSILFFVKDECPCSIEAQPVFNRLASAYGGDAQFFAVIDGSASVANQFVLSNAVPFPVLADSDQVIIQGFKMRASAGVALIDKTGQILEVWPGYSKSSLRQINFLLGTLVGTGPREFDDREAPEDLTAGCAFTLN